MGLYGTDLSRDNRLRGEQTGLAQTGAGRTIMKLPLVSRLSAQATYVGTGWPGGGQGIGPRKRTYFWPS